VLFAILCDNRVIFLDLFEGFLILFILNFMQRFDFAEHLIQE